LTSYPIHTQKTVLAYTEDLRTFLKTKQGSRLAAFPDGKLRPVAGEDLRPMHDEARRIVDDAIVSDVPLLYSPGQVGLAAMMVANEDLQRKQSASGAEGGGTIPNINLAGYVRLRFEERTEVQHAQLAARVEELQVMLRGLREGSHGCGNHGIDMAGLKAVHKKLKKCRAWGPQEDGDKGKKKKKKKRKAEDGEAEPTQKKAKS